ncbi:hypothetical protein ACFLTQ_01075 [Chloroflexota bacterium]
MAGDKVIGHLEGNKFIKTVSGSKHMLRQPRAWAVDAEVFDNEVIPNATEIIIKDREGCQEYHASIETFDRLKGQLDRGFGRQYYLTLNHWQIYDNGHKQLSLWGGD